MQNEFRYFELSSKEGDRPIGFDVAVNSIQGTFPHVDLDEEAALSAARARKNQLARLGAPPDVIKFYENLRAIRIQIYIEGSSEHHLEFDLWDVSGPDASSLFGFDRGQIHRLAARPRPDDARFDACGLVARQLADLLGYGLSVEFGYDADEKCFKE